MFKDHNIVIKYVKNFFVSKISLYKTLLNTKKKQKKVLFQFYN